MWSIKPSIGNVVVVPQTEDEVTAAGIILIAPAVERESHIAEVVAICDPYPATGFDPRHGPMWQIGQLVIIGKYNGREIKFRQDRTKPEERYIIIRESDILGLLETKHDSTVS